MIALGHPLLRQRCHACHWFARHPATEDFAPTGGHCWRYPPTVVAVPNPPRWIEDGQPPASIEMYRPYIDKLDGCGEWKGPQ